MKTRVVNALFYFGGAAVGSLVTWYGIKKYYKKVADEEIQSVLDEVHKIKLSLLTKANDILKPENSDGDDVENVDTGIGRKVNTRRVDYTSYSKQNQFNTDDIQDELRANEHPEDENEREGCILITTDQYDGSPDFRKLNVYYHMDEDIFKDEGDETDFIDEDGKTLGSYESLVSAAVDGVNFRNNDLKVLYVRNFSVQADFEIVKLDI